MESGTADDRLVHLGQAIRDELSRSNHSQRWLADQLDVDTGYLSRIISGKHEGLSLEVVVRIEDALGVGRGDLLRAAGYVDGDVTLSAALASDPGLTESQRRALRSVVRSWAPEQP